MRSQLMNVLMGVLVIVAVTELAYAYATRRQVHDFRDSLSSLALGIGQQAINIYLSASVLAVWPLIHDNFALASGDMGTWWHWLLFVPACDLCYYLAHRAGHTVNFWVAAHIVHHHSRDFNHVSSFRQSWTAWLVNFPFFFPLAFFVPLEMFVVGQLGIMFLQFFGHNGVTRMKFGPLERLLITPSNHRVHHGYNRPYLNKNMGGMLVLWDRVFGTFVEEDPEVPIELGTPFEFNFYDPFEANLDYYRRVAFVSWHRPSWLGRLAIWFQSPRTLMAELKRYDFDGWRARQAVQRGPVTGRYIALAGGLLLGVIGVFWVHRLTFPTNSVPVRLLTGAAVMGALVLLGRVLSAPAPAQSSAEGLGRSQVNAR